MTKEERGNWIIVHVRLGRAKNLMLNWNVSNNDIAKRGCWDKPGEKDWRCFMREPIRCKCLGGLRRSVRMWGGEECQC